MLIQRQQKKAIKLCEIYSELTIKTPDVILVSLLLFLNISHLFLGLHVNVSWHLIVDYQSSNITPVSSVSMKIVKWRGFFKYWFERHLKKCYGGPPHNGAFLQK